ncbi:Uncharacterised protein [Bordetella pertussis]|nr:Uncharacterised protein [Bordetella pertussis]
MACSTSAARRPSAIAACKASWSGSMRHTSSSARCRNWPRTLTVAASA